MLALQMFSLPQSSTIAKNVDQLYNFAFYVSLISFAAVITALVYFSARYHRKKSDPEKTPYIEGHPLLEGTVIMALFVLVMVLFYWGWVDYKQMRHAPLNSMEINVTARQWNWDFQYVNGRSLNSLKKEDMLVVPLGRPVKLIMTSQDVIHSFYIPDFRVKQDVVPGTYSTLWFNATELGEHQVFCAEYCGTLHSGMFAKVKVVTPEEYDHWQKKWEWEKQLGISSSPPSVPAGENAQNSATGVKDAVPAPSTDTPVGKGQKLFTEKGCTACHTVNGQPLIGPTLKGIFGHEVELEGGKKILADENYIRESLVEPQAKITKGFQPVMPTFKGTLSDEEIGALISYIKSLQN